MTGTNSIKKLFHEEKLETQTKYDPEGTIRTWPCSFNMDRTIPLERGPITVRGKMIVEENGTSLFMPYRSTKNSRYLQVYKKGRTTIKVTKADILIISRINRNQDYQNVAIDWHNEIESADEFILTNKNSIFEV